MNAYAIEAMASARRLSLAGMACAALLLGCRGESPADLIKSARDYQARGDQPAAIIQLKNAIQKQPENGEARLLLGQVTLATGDAVTAEKELRKAREYGQPPAIVDPLLAQAMLDGGAVDKVVSEFGGSKLDDAKANAELRAIVGQAQMRLGKPEDAAASFAAAIADDPANLQARLGTVRLLASTGKVDEANAAIDPIVAAYPKSPDALTLQGTLRLLKGDRPAARVAFQQAIDADPTRAGARLDLIATLLADREFDAASEQVAAGRKARGGDLRFVYFAALIAYETKDLARARELNQQLLKAAPDHVPSLVLAGAIELQERKPALAEGYLLKAVTLAPRHDGARKLLVRSYMSSNQPVRALDVMRPLVEQSKHIDAATMLIAGETYLANGDFKQAANFFSAATQSKEQETGARIRLGQIAMATGDPERGIKELEAASAVEGAPIQADLALIAGYMRRNDTAKALEVARALVKKQPKLPISHQVLGAVLAARKDAAGARASFNEALALNPNYMPAIAALSRLDLAENKPADARARFEAVIAKEPNNETALVGLAELLLATKAPAKEVVAVLQKAIAARPQSATARLHLISVYLQDKDSRAALQAAQEAAVALPDDARVLDLLGRAQQVAGENNQAIETFTRLAKQQPQSTQPLLRLASVYAGMKDYERTIEVLLRAQKLAPADPAIGRDLVLGYLMAGKPDQAFGQARALQAAAPKSAAGFLLEGDIHASTRQWAQAERSYRDALKAEPDSAAAAVKLHGVLIGAGKKPDADALARKWLTDHPQDMAFRMYVAEQALRARDYKAAVVQYQAVVKEQPNNVAALNNLAWAAGQIGDPKAIEYAERAVKLAPDSALVLDTAGVLLVGAGDTSRGLEYLTRAVALAPDRHDIRLNYAKALIKAGKPDLARKELEQLQSAAVEFSGKSEVAELLKKLPAQN